jgi:hypothetical protein
MELSIKCNGVRRGFVVSICVAFATIFLDNRVNSVEVIGSIRHRGKVIRGSISRTPKEWPRHIRSAKSSRPSKG